VSVKTLREYENARYDDLAATDTLELSGRAPHPVPAAAPSKAQIAAALRRARRHDPNVKAVQTLTRYVLNT
jgi:hypothetical protein